MKLSISLCFLVTALFGFRDDVVEAGKILAFTPTAAYSHFIGQHKLYLALAAAGHEITVVSPFPNKSPVANYTDIPLTSILKTFEEMKKDIGKNLNMNIFEIVEMIYGSGITISKVAASEESFQNLLKSKAQFDVILVEFFLDEFLVGLGHHFNAPIIGISTVGANKWVNDFIANPSPLSYVPHTFLPVTSSMTFAQRIGNVFMTYLEEFYMELIYHPKQELIYNEAFPDPKPTYSEARRNAVHMIMVNSHFSIGAARPQLPNVIEVGGIHINRDQKPLPKDLETFIDSAKNGVIYFSFGSNIQPSTLDEKITKAIIQTLLKRKEHIIWKWDGDLPEIAGKKNFFVSKWLPQDDILRHPKVKLFITHGGLQSTLETIYHGVPVVGVPFFGDQELNMAKAEQVGYGKALNIKDLTEQRLTDALNEVLNNSAYRQKILELSKRFKDQPLAPLELAKYWVEYVIRHKGAKHMRSAAMDLGFFQLYSFDTLGLILAVILIVLGSVVFVIKKLLRLVTGSPQKKQKRN